MRKANDCDRGPGLVAVLAVLVVKSGVCDLQGCWRRGVAKVPGRGLRRWADDRFRTWGFEKVDADLYLFARKYTTSSGIWQKERAKTVGTQNRKEGRNVQRVRTGDRAVDMAEWKSC